MCYRFLVSFFVCFAVQNSLDQQVKELSTRLDEEVANATKAAKRDAAKLQARVSRTESSRQRNWCNYCKNYMYNSLQSLAK